MKRQLWLLLALLTAARWFYGAINDLSPDETYYYMWSQRLDLAYYSKGPGVALVIRAATMLFGPSEFGVRFFAPLLALGTSLVIFALARRLYDERTAFWSVLLMQCTPIFNVGGIVMTVDALSLFFWALTVWWFWLALEKSPRFSIFWPLTGLALALGLLCKYTNLAALFSMALLLLAVRAWRSEWRRPGIYSALLVTSLGLIPPLIWNSRNAWITLTHMSERGGLDEPFALHPGQPFEYLGAHFGVYSPLIFAGLLVSFGVGLAHWRSHRKTAFLIAFALPLLALYFGLALKEAGEANWTAPALITLAIYATHDWLRRSERLPVWGKFSVAALLLGAVLTLVVLNTEALRTLGIRWPYEKDAATRLIGWKETGALVTAVRHEVEAKIGGKVFLIANKYQTAAELAWYLPEKPLARPGHPPVYIPESQMIQNQFSFWPGYDTFEDAPPSARDPFDTEEDGVNYLTGSNALYITDRPEGKPASVLLRGFARWEYYGARQVLRHGLAVRELRFFICYDYQTLPL